MTFARSNILVGNTLHNMRIIGNSRDRETPSKPTETFLGSPSFPGEYIHGLNHVVPSVAFLLLAHMVHKMILGSLSFGSDDTQSSSKLPPGYCQ